MSKEILNNYSHMINEDDKILISKFCFYQKNIINTLKLLTDHKIKTGKFMDDLLFKICVILRYI